MLRMKCRHYLIIAEVRPPIHHRLPDTETKTSSKIEFSRSLKWARPNSMLAIERYWAVSILTMEGMWSIENEVCTPNHSLHYVVSHSEECGTRSKWTRISNEQHRSYGNVTNSGNSSSRPQLLYATYVEKHILATALREKNMRATNTRSHVTYNHLLCVHFVFVFSSLVHYTVDYTHSMPNASHITAV